MVNRIVKLMVFFLKEKEEEERKGEEEGGNIKGNSLGIGKFGGVWGLGIGRRDMGDFKWGCEMGFK